MCGLQKRIPLPLFFRGLGVFVVRFSLKIVRQKLTTCLELTPTSNCILESAILLSFSLRVLGSLAFTLLEPAVKSISTAFSTA